jgi:hypothetical protein
MLILCWHGGRAGLIGAQPLSLPGNHVIPAGGFILLFAATWLVSLAMLLFFPEHLPVGNTCLLIFMLALTCRLLLLPHPPSDDINRYLWEGKVLASGVSPYTYAPSHPRFNDLAREDPYHSQINHPKLPAAYPPFVIGIFASVGKLWYHPLAFKLLAIIFDLATLTILLSILHRHHLNLRWSLLYALNPVILYSFAGQGHFDSIQCLLVLSALHCYERKRWRLMFLLFGLAIQTKYVAILGLPLFVRRDNWRALWIAVLAVALPYLPFVLHGETHELLACLLHFGRHFAFNGSLHGLLRASLGSLSAATRICEIILFIVLVWGYRHFHPQLNPYFHNDPVPGCLFVFGSLILFSPTVHFWYLSWLIPFVVLRPSSSWIALSLTISGYFVTNGIVHFSGAWLLPAWVQVLEWLPVYLLLAHELHLGWHRSRSRLAPAPAPRSISVVIPTHNEEGRIRACLKAVFQATGIAEVLVVDSGSIDRTAKLARSAGARVLQHQQPLEQGGGRGGQIRAGILAARGDVVVILHADTILPAHIPERILHLLKRNPSIIGGAVGALFDQSDWRLWLLECLNNLRMLCLGISFGDQVQFFRRQPVVEQDLFPNLPLMEDVEFSLRLQQRGRQTLLFGNALVSARRWQQSGYRRSLLVIRLVVQYLWQRLWGRLDASAMYRCYYDCKRRI